MDNQNSKLQMSLSVELLHWTTFEHPPKKKKKMMIHCIVLWKLLFFEYFKPTTLAVA